GARGAGGGRHASIAIPMSANSGGQRDRDRRPVEREHPNPARAVEIVDGGQASAPARREQGGDLGAAEVDADGEKKGKRPEPISGRSGREPAPRGAPALF